MGSAIFCRQSGRSGCRSSSGRFHFARNSCSGGVRTGAETARRGSGSASGRYAGERSATSLEHARGLSGDCAATGHAYRRADC